MEKGQLADGLDGGSGEQQAVAQSQTGLGVAGMLRRIGLWAVEDAIKGEITVAGKELVRWLRAADRCCSPDLLSTSAMHLRIQCRWIHTASSLVSCTKEHANCESLVCPFATECRNLGEGKRCVIQLLCTRHATAESLC